MTLTIIGAGKMGEALARGILDAGLIPPQNLTLADIAAERVKQLAADLGATATTDNEEAVRNASLVILAVKPKDATAACREITKTLPAGAIVLSIVTGFTLRALASALERGDLLLARAMPNTPCLVGAGAFGLAFSESMSPDARHTVRDLLTPLGLVEEVPESLLDAVTGLIGSGPAYVALFIEALADGGVLAGIPRAQAERLAAQTVLGTAKLILDTRQHPAQVKDAVATPSGTTIAGIQALEEHGFRAAAIAAVKAAAARAREISGE